MKKYCTCWFDGTWGHCCKRHDSAYTLGIPFLEANWRLLKCVNRRNSIFIAGTMLAGTTLFGWAWYLKAKYKRRFGR